jgi:hypothetical protein
MDCVCVFGGVEDFISFGFLVSWVVVVATNGWVGG